MLGINKKIILNKFYLILLFFVALFFVDNSLVFANEEEAELQRQALLETADAYYRQGEQLQYDSYRKNLLATPEDATSQHYTYTVCSGFTFQVYYQTLGIRIPDYTEALLDYAQANVSYKDNILVYYRGIDTVYGSNVLGTSESSNYSNLIKEWIKFVKPGDIVVVTGHSMMISDVDYDNGKITIVESGSGTRYDYINHIEKYDEAGTINYYDLEYRLRTYYNRLKTGKNIIEEIAIIRYVTDGSSYINVENKIDTYNGITDAAKSRLKFSKIDIEKTLTIKNGDVSNEQTLLVDLDETITYNISIINSSNVDYESFSVVENIDSRVSLVDNGNGSFDGQKLQWTVPSLKAGSSVTLTYTIKIPNDQNLLGETIVSSGFVDKIATSKIETLVGYKLDNEKVTKLINSFNKLKDSEFLEREFINEIYKDALGLDLGISLVKNLDIISFDSNILYGQDSLSIKGTKVNDTEVAKYIFSNFYGLRIGAVDDKDNSVVRSILQWNIYAPYENYDRARTIDANMLLDGDIILGYLGNKSTNDTDLVDKAYIYLNNKLIRKTGNNSFEELTGDELTVFLRNLVGDNYVILRPSVALNTVDNDTTIDDDTVIDNGSNNEENKDSVSGEGNVIENPQTGFFVGGFVLMFALVISLFCVYKYGLINNNKIMKK